MKPVSAVNMAIAVAAAVPVTTFAGRETFDRVPTGGLPSGWVAGVTGRGAPSWKVIADPSAPSAPNVLSQSGAGTFPWAVRRDVSLLDGFVETRFKSISGRV